MSLIKVLLYKLICIFITWATLSSSVHGQHWIEQYSSSSYGYHITIPKSFEQIASESEQIDQLFIDDYGASILVNVTSRIPEEYNITAHDYTREMLESLYRQVSPNLTIGRVDRIYVDRQPAFLIEYSGGIRSNLKAMECYFFYDELAFTITATASIEKFDNYRQLFEGAIKSINFKL